MPQPDPAPTVATPPPYHWHFIVVFLDDGGHGAEELFQVGARSEWEARQLMDAEMRRNMPYLQQEGVQQYWVASPTVDQLHQWTEKIQRGRNKEE